MKTDDWDALIPELKDWNNGKGIDPESWVGCEGNFRLAIAYSLIFWPEFNEVDGMIFWGEINQETLASWMRNCSGVNDHAKQTRCDHVKLTRGSLAI